MKTESYLGISEYIFYFSVKAENWNREWNGTCLERPWLAEWNIQHDHSTTCYCKPQT